MARQPKEQRGEMSICSELQRQHAIAGNNSKNSEPVVLEEYAPLFAAPGRQELIVRYTWKETPPSI